MSKKIVVVLFVVIGLLQSCNTTEPPPPDEKLTLTLILEDASSIEAWIKLTTTNLQLPTTVTLKQSASVGNSVTQDIILSYADTVIYIDSLLPKTTYLFQVSSIEHPASSNQLQVTTMDTTSHNFTWQTWTFGEHSSSVLNDVAIIDENNIWAVGEIYMNDSLGNPDPNAYNAVHWDGSEWRVKKITVEFRGNMIIPPLEGVFALSGTDIWFVGSLPIHGDGTNWTMYDLRTTVDPNLSLSKAWGSNSNDMYFVGRAGSIAHYSGPTGGWQKIESGTELNIGDIWGVQNSEGNFSKYCAADDAMLIIKNYNELFKINVEPWMFLNSVWGVSDRLIYTAGDGVVLYKNNEWQKINSPDVNTIYGIKGQNYNDVFGISSMRTILHFNGYSWHSINSFSNSVFFRLNVKNNLTASVGWQGDKAVITIIRRNKGEKLCRQ